MLKVSIVTDAFKKWRMVRKAVANVMKKYNKDKSLFMMACAMTITKTKKITNDEDSVEYMTLELIDKIREYRRLDVPAKIVWKNIRFCSYSSLIEGVKKAWR